MSSEQDRIDRNRETLEDIYSEVSETSERVARIDERMQSIQGRLDDVESDVEDVQDKTDENSRKITVGVVIGSGLAAWIVENISVSLPLLIVF